MRIGKAWATVTLGLLGCLSSRLSDVDAAHDAHSDDALSDETSCCADGGGSEPVSSTGFDAGAASSAPAASDEPPDALAEERDAGSSSAAGARREAGCTYLDEHFDEGATFPSNDGCNTCQCMSGLTWCSLVGCLRRPPACDLPFDPGSCNESHTYYAHNPSTGVCEAKVYSGCGGNLNRFPEYGICAYTCSVSKGSGNDCTYQGATYHHRQRVARKPSEMTGCGPCLCNDGEVLCPPADCQCLDGKKLGLQCVGCTTGGKCEAQEERCFPACDSDADCDTSHAVFCDKVQGVCISTPDCLR